MKKIINNRGFTLIELLVVIAIIGILSSVVLASLSTARAKGEDAKIKGQLSSMRSQAELYSNASMIAFGTAATCAATVNTLFESGNNGLSNLLTPLTIGSGRCAAEAIPPSAGGRWAVAFPLKSGGSWCVDSTGVSRSSTNAITVVLADNTYACAP